MALFRTKDVNDFQNYGTCREKHIIIATEWDENSGLARYLEPTWQERYKAEASLITDICTSNGYSKILELGSGPGQLGQFILNSNPSFSYTFIDKLAAKTEFEKRKFKGNFFVKNLFNEFDISELDTDYDLVIANDFLEHIANPSDVMYKSRSITKNKAGFFASVPNWRMGHTFIYRGLFDFDNWVYFCQCHGWTVVSVDGSNLKCSKNSKLSSEDLLSDDLIDSWNWYFNCSKK